ncbi:hypothetical protein A3K71_05530 [archaeon RBG_16_50_20]|nr:MAG: hypothetical protein A3K71_05530 [archaeon RBG_16_50_20]
MTTMPKTMMVKRAMVMTIARETRTPPMGTKREKAGSLSSTQYIHSSDYVLSQPAPTQYPVGRNDRSFGPNQALPTVEPRRAR